MWPDSAFSRVAFHPLLPRPYLNCESELDRLPVVAVVVRDFRTILTLPTAFCHVMSCLVLSCHLAVFCCNSFTSPETPLMLRTVSMATTWTDATSPSFTLRCVLVFGAVATTCPFCSVCVCCVFSRIRLGWVGQHTRAENTGGISVGFLCVFRRGEGGGSDEVPGALVLSESRLRDLSPMMLVLSTACVRACGRAGGRRGCPRYAAVSSSRWRCVALYVTACRCTLWCVAIRCKVRFGAPNVLTLFSLPPDERSI